MSLRRTPSGGPLWAATECQARGRGEVPAPAEGQGLPRDSSLWGADDPAGQQQDVPELGTQQVGQEHAGWQSRDTEEAGRQQLGWQEEVGTAGGAAEEGHGGGGSAAGRGAGGGLAA